MIKQSTFNVTKWFPTLKEAEAFEEGVMFSDGGEELLTVVGIETSPNKHGGEAGFVVRLFDKDYDGEDYWLC
jgi:hypothetical protein